MVMPPSEAAAKRFDQPRETVFIIDTSGSMGGASIREAKAALDLALARLDPGDSFNVIEFNSVTRVLFPASKPATPGNVETAREWVSELESAGGTEMLSYINAEGMKMREAGLGGGGMGVGNPRLQAKHPQTNQGVAADAIAAMEGITRAELEQMGVESQRRAAIALQEGRFAKSTIPVKDDEGNVILDHEEYPRPETTAESLAELKPAFEMFYNMPSEPGGKTYVELINQVFPEVEVKP